MSESIETTPTDTETGEARPSSSSLLSSSEKNRENHERSESDVAAASAEPQAEQQNATSNERETELSLLSPGNPLRWRALIPLAISAFGAFLLMAKDTQVTWGVPAGAALVAMAAWAIMDLLGTFDDAESPVAKPPLAPTRTVGRATEVLVLLVAFCLSLVMAQAGGPWWLGSVLVTGSFLGLVAAVFRFGQELGPWRLDENGLERPLFRRHGFGVIAIGALLYFPAMGLQSLWDPWETHYGEVAREVLARDDWVSLWWAQDGWFWSKPVLNFWIQALSMATLGTNFHSDLMLSGAAGAWSAHPEWAVRTPNVLMTLAAMYLLYKGVTKVFGRRAGFLGALVLATMSDWFFLAHQTMTDMPFVAAMTGAMGLLLYGLNSPEEERVTLYAFEAFGRRVRVSLWHMVFGAVLVCAIPQILYLFSRNLELVLHGDGPRGFRLHWDEFKSGSALNCGIPGNEACTMHTPASIPKSVAAFPVGIKASVVRYVGGFEPSLQGLVWSVILGAALYLNWGERRVRRLSYIAAWLCAAIATMAKGPAGFALPVLCALAYVATTRRWNELLRFEIVTGLLVLLGVALPWYVAMYVRHGSPFTDRLIFHDMFNRAFAHVHDTNEGDDTGIRFYLWQLGYALFPWTGLAPLGLIWGFRRSDSALANTGAAGTGGKTSAVGDATVMLVMWFLFAFFLFTFMGTKFHHYIFPAVPPVAMLVGIVLDDLLGKEPLAKRSTFPLYAFGLTLGAGLATWGASRAWQGNVFGEILEPSRTGNARLALGIVAAGIAVIALTAVLLRYQGTRVIARSEGYTEEPSLPSERTAAHEDLMLAGAVLLGAFVLVLVGRDLVIKPEGTDQPGAIRLLQLFTYNYKRPWPETLDFTAILGGFTAAGALLTAGVSIGAFRRHAATAFCSLSLLWAVWGLDVYMVKTSPHWGQHEVIEAYYKNRKSPDELLVAYQMNWKGENFYTGNHIPAFVSTGATFQTWLKTQKEQKNAKTMYFVTEHSRVNGLRGELNAKSYKEMTTRALCNKFVLVRAEL